MSGTIVNQAVSAVLAALRLVAAAGNDDAATSPP